MESPSFLEDPTVPLPPIYDLDDEGCDLDSPRLCYNSKDSVDSTIHNNAKPSHEEFLRIYHKSRLSERSTFPNDSGVSYNSKDSNESVFPIDSELLYVTENFEDLVKLRHPVDRSFQANTTNINEDHGLFPAKKLHEDFSLTTSSSFGSSKVTIDELKEQEEFARGLISPNAIALNAIAPREIHANGIAPKELVRIKEIDLAAARAAQAQWEQKIQGQEKQARRAAEDESRDDFNDNQICISPGQPDDNSRVLYRPEPECSDHGCNKRYSGSCSNLPHHQSKEGNASDQHSISNWDVLPATSKNRDCHNSQSPGENINTKEESLCSSSLTARVGNPDSKPGSIYGFRCPTLEFCSSCRQSSSPNFFTSADVISGNLPQESLSGPRNDDTKPTAMEEEPVLCGLTLSDPSIPKLEPSCKQTKVQDSPTLSYSCSSWSSDDDIDLGDEESDREGYTTKMEILTKCNASMTENQTPGFDTHPFFFKLKHELIDPIMSEFWENFNRREEAIRSKKGITQNKKISKCNGSGKSSTAEQNTPSTSETDSSTTTSPKQGSETFKDEGRSKTRKRLGKGDDSDNEENKERNPKRPRNLARRSRILDDARKFACPYRKHDAKKYCIQNWRSCALTSLDSVARVKGHLYRHHRIFQCQRCKRLFSDQQEVNDHLKQEEACELSKDVQEDGITNEIMEKLRSKKKTHRSQSEEDRWKEMYRTIFSTDVVPDPYFEEVQEDCVQPLNAQELTDYEEYCRQELPKVIEAELKKTINSLEKQLKKELLEIIRNAQDRVFASYRSSLTLPGTKDGSEASPYSGSYVAAFTNSSSEIRATGYQFTNDESGETCSTQELERLPSQIDLDSRLDVTAPDREATDPEYNDWLKSVLNATPDISLLTTKSITNTPASSLENLPRLPVNRGETSEAESKAANLPLGYSIDKGKNTTDYFDSSLLQNAMDFDFDNMDFSNFDMSYFDNVEPSLLEN